MKRILGVIVACIMVAVIAYKGHIETIQSDPYLRDHIVKLFSQEGSCSGVKVKGASGITYVLTAAHCFELVRADGHIESEDENGEKHDLELVEISLVDDLMLLTSNSDDGLNIGKAVHNHDHVHTMTRGMGLPSFRTDGEACGESGHNIGDIPWHYYLVTTTMTMPGSSGGPLLNENNEVVGILTGGNGVLSLWTPLADIQKFMSIY